MQTRVIVNGARGKMGQMACQTIADHSEFELVAALGRGDSLNASIQELQAQIVIDLTRADCVYENALTIIEAGAHPVIGTSGLVTSQIQALHTRCEQRALGGLIVPNFSIGAVLMMHFAKEAARFMSEVEIIETHHQQKLDAPSGTALKTAELIAMARVGEKNQLAVKEIVAHARGATHQDVPIHSIRLPGVLACQEVIFGQNGETLKITHHSIDRSSFMPGLILACQQVLQLTTLVYGLEQLLFAHRHGE